MAEQKDVFELFSEVMNESVERLQATLDRMKSSTKKEEPATKTQSTLEDEVEDLTSRVLTLERIINNIGRLIFLNMEPPSDVDDWLIR